MPSSYGKYPQVGKDAPANAQQLWYTLYNMPNDGDTRDGYRIQTVLGPDGQTRLVVYINGTFGGKDLGISSNISAIVGGGTAETTEVQRAIAAAEKAARDNGASVSEVMLVGYSQGGMIAQNIADGGRSDPPISAIVTYGSPVVEAVNDYGGAHVIRIADRTDLVPQGVIPLADDAARGIDDAVGLAQGRLLSAGSHSATFDYTDPAAVVKLADAAAIGEAVDPFGGAISGWVAQALADHSSNWMYGDDSGAFDASQSAQAGQAHADIERFGGIVTADVS